jgi:hypothetical protein
MAAYALILLRFLLSLYNHGYLDESNLDFRIHLHFGGISLCTEVTKLTYSIDHSCSVRLQPSKLNKAKCPHPNRQLDVEVKWDSRAARETKQIHRSDH